MIHPDDRDFVRQTIQQSLETHTDYEAEYRTIWSDGSIHWILARGRAIYDSDGRPLRIVGVTLDFSARKRIEAEREQILQREQTAREGRSLTERANRIKDEFLAVTRDLIAFILEQSGAIVTSVASAITVISDLSGFPEPYA